MICPKGFIVFYILKCDKCHISNYHPFMRLLFANFSQISRKLLANFELCEKSIFGQCIPTFSFRLIE